MKDEFRNVEFVGSGIQGCPLVRGDSHALKCGNVYEIKKSHVEAGMLLLRICDQTGKILGTFPAQWFNPTYRPLMPTN